MDIQNKILKFAASQKTFKTSDIVKAFDQKISRGWISLQIKELVKQKKLIKSGSTASATYALPQNASEMGNRIMRRLKREGLKEHKVLDSINHQAPFLLPLKENIRSLFDYGFLEMLNNAIEHSLAKSINLEIAVFDESLQFIVSDNGIGAFKNVMQKHGLNSEIEAIQDILKGKTTTNPEAHSGQGIFFTSKAADIFVIDSYGYRLRVDNTITDVFIEELSPVFKGTKVTFTIDVKSKKHLINIFKEYQTDPEGFDFDKTVVQIKLYTMGTIYVSRSQARRVLTGLEKYKHIILDFDRVPTIGQAFADEIFRVFKVRFPEIVIEPINMNEAVGYMVKRVDTI